jgi:hypothetical protein
MISLQATLRRADARSDDQTNPGHSGHSDHYADPYPISSDSRIGHLGGERIGYPVKDVAVTERYGFYAPRILTSDAQGHVRFEPRVPWTSFAHRLLASASAAKGPIYPEASGFESLVAVGHGMTGNVRMSWSGSPIDRSTRITMHPVYKPIRTTGH